jgi:hypothetical protein
MRRDSNGRLLIPDRIVYSIVAVAISFIFLVVYFPAVAVFITFSGAGATILIMERKYFRQGFVQFCHVRYERRNSPIGFWFYTLVVVGMGIFICVSAVLFLFHKI